jgi:hypothetical protein
VGVGELDLARVERSENVEREVVGAIRQRLEAKLRPVELRVWHRCWSRGEDKGRIVKERKGINHKGTKDTKRDTKH